MQRIEVIEQWALQLKRNPTFFTERPMSEHPLYAETLHTKRAVDHTPGAGIGQAVPKRDP